MSSDRMKISWDELSSPAVEERLKQQDAVAGTASHYEATEVAVPRQSRRLEWLYNAIVYLSLFGALGGILGWGFGEVLHYHKDLKAQANVLAAQYSDVVAQQKKINATPEELAHALAPVMRAGRDNPYFKIYTDSSLSEDEQGRRTLAIDAQVLHRDFIADLLFYGISGIAISMLLAAADSIMERNINGAIIYGTIGAIIGAAGGLVVALIDYQIAQQLTPATEAKSYVASEITNAICWGLLGLFLAAAPGLILRNGKRLLIGVIGGVTGGVIGGLLFDPIEEYTGNSHLSRLIAIMSIGLLTGLFSGIIENAIKAGWLKVESGLIAGKQFVLYRNPTFIGSHPMSHIYLFNDPHIGKRHACVHIVGNGYEIEDLPLGTRTYVNGKAVSRARLHNGDELRVGGTVFKFQEKAKAVERMAVLLIDIGEVRTINLADGHTIGRESGSDIVIPHPTVSRHHGRIERINGNYHLFDAASRNGTRVNGKAVEEETLLPDGARLRIGHVRAWFFEQPPHSLPRPSARRGTGIVFNCVCGQRLWSATDTVGMSVVCTACGQTIEIPDTPAKPVDESGNTVAGLSLDAPAEADTRTACAVCQWPIEAGDSQHVCASCGVPFHADCWVENKGCSTYGCPQVNALVKQEEPAVISMPADGSILDLPAGDAQLNHSEKIGSTTSWPHLLLGLSVLGSLLGLLAFGIPAALIGLIALGRLLTTRAGHRGLLAGAVLIAIAGALAGYRVSGLWWWDRPLF